MSILNRTEKREQRQRLFAGLSDHIVTMEALPGEVYSALLADGWTYQIDQSKSTKVRYISPSYRWVQMHGKAVLHRAKADAPTRTLETGKPA